MSDRMVEPRVRISYDDMEAYLYLEPPVVDEQPYTVAELLDCLEMKGIQTGVNKDVLEQMIQGNVFQREVCVAKGIPVIDGKDGYFVYNFSQETNRKPTLKADGSVDYWSVNLIETVVKGQTIVQYHGAVQGTNGMTIKGTPIIAKKGKEQPPLKGRGFSRSADNSTYTAELDGKIEMQRDHIVISAIHEIFGNVDLNYGDLNFPGDILIHGNVCSGVSIKATGTVTIDGMAEACDIDAGKDVIIRNGINGAYRGKVKAKGNVVTRYVEYATVIAKGTVQADVFLESQIECSETIMLTGKHGSMIGGNVAAVKGVQANAIGNDVEVRTEVSVGTNDSTHKRIQLLQRKIETTRTNLERIEKGISDFDKIEKETGVSLREDPRRSQLLRMKIKDAATIAADQAELTELERTVENAAHATVRVTRTVYPGTEIAIDSLKVRVQEYQESVEFVKRMDKIIMCSLGAE